MWSTLRTTHQFIKRRPRPRPYSLAQTILSALWSCTKKCRKQSRFDTFDHLFVYNLCMVGGRACTCVCTDFDYDFRSLRGVSRTWENSVRSLHKGWKKGLDGIVTRTRNGLRAARRRDRGRLSSGRRTGRGEGWGEESLLQGYGTMHLYTSSRYSKALGKDEGKHRRRIESSHAMRPPV